MLALPKVGKSNFLLMLTFLKQVVVLCTCRSILQSFVECQAALGWMHFIMK